MHKTFACDFQILFTQINLCSKVNHCLFFIFICNLQSKRHVPLPFFFFLARICSVTWLPWYLLRYSCDKSLNVVRAASWYNEPRVFPWRGELRVHVSFVNHIPFVSSFGAGTQLLCKTFPTFSLKRLFEAHLLLKKFFIVQ